MQVEEKSGLVKHLCKLGSSVSCRQAQEESAALQHTRPGPGGGGGGGRGGGAGAGTSASGGAGAGAGASASGGGGGGPRTRAPQVSSKWVSQSELVPLLAVGPRAHRKSAAAPAVSGAGHSSSAAMDDDSVAQAFEVTQLSHTFHAAASQLHVQLEVRNTSRHLLRNVSLLLCCEHGDNINGTSGACCKLPPGGRAAVSAFCVIPVELTSCSPDVTVDAILSGVWCGCGESVPEAPADPIRFAVNAGRIVLGPDVWVSAAPAALVRQTPVPRAVEVGARSSCRFAETGTCPCPECIAQRGPAIAVATTAAPIPNVSTGRSQARAILLANCVQCFDRHGNTGCVFALKFGKFQHEHTIVSCSCQWGCCLQCLGDSQPRMLFVEIAE